MVEWGVKEALITHNTEVLVYDGKEYYTCPLKPLGLAGRTGRGRHNLLRLHHRAGAGKHPPGPGLRLPAGVAEDADTGAL